MSIFRRLFKIGQAEAHSAIDKLEDPIKLTEQGIRDLKKQLDEALRGLAEVKALAIRARNDEENYAGKAKDYEKKAMLLLQRAGQGDLSAEEADRLATESLLKKKENEDQAARSNADKVKFEGHVTKLDGNIKSLRQQVSKFENELRTLKARVRVSKATKKINQQMAGLDSTSTVSMLERMKDKVAQEEALAESYGDIASESRSVDDEIAKALEGSASTEASADLEALKAKMGLGGAKEGGEGAENG